jgi:ubiquinone/menaquinone biosynthesis C-methylase UbiE
MIFHQVFSKFYNMAAERMSLDCTDFIKEGDKILDLGCGTGIVAKNFGDFFGTEVLGVDIEDKRQVSIPFKMIDGKSLPFEDLSFDVVLISYVLHHARDPVALLKEAERVAKRIIIYEDLPEGFFSRLRCIFHQVSYNIFFQHNFQKFNFKTKTEWESLFKSLGLKIIIQKPVSTPFDWFDPVNRILFVLEKD